MLVAFFKSAEDRDCQCEIAKFVDRIWIDKSGALYCIRTFIVHVLDTSAAPLKEIHMLLPFRQIAEIDEISKTCMDINYPFNDTSFGGYEIRSVDDAHSTSATIMYDHFLTQVYASNVIKHSPCPNSPTGRIVTIDFHNHPLLTGQFRLVRMFFKITSVLDQVFDRVYNLDLNYFYKLDVSDCYKMLKIDPLEIPVNKLFNKDNDNQGGFDIFLHLPETLSSTNFKADYQTISKQLYDGTLSENNHQKFLWRGRLQVPEEEQYLRSGIRPISIEGLINDPHEMEEIRGEIIQVKNETSDLSSRSKKALRVAIIALIISSISFIALNYSGISNFASNCLKKLCSAPNQSPEKMNTKR